MNSDSTSDLAQGARKLLQQSSAGSLATQSQKHPGYPFVSLTPYALASTCDPILLLSGLATHTRNAKRNSAVSLLVTESGKLFGDPAASRLTLLGDLRLVSESELDSARQAYLRRHPAAQQWANFGDFAFFGLQLLEACFVAGFGSMGWLSPERLESD